MNIIVTSGGTEEPIDRVRSITNKSSGALGSLIAMDYAQAGATVYYVYNGHTPPTHSNIVPVKAVTVDELAQTVTTLLTTHNIHIFVHAMAVSDYKVANVSDGKISSTEDTITLVLQKNIKVISTIKSTSPSTMLVGFKLLVDVSEKELHNTACNLLKKNSADYVVANDLTNITGDKHQAIIVDKQGNYNTFYTKKDIAQAIIKYTMEKNV